MSPAIDRMIPDITSLVGGSLAGCAPLCVALAASLICMSSLCWALCSQAKLRNFKRRTKIDLAAADLARNFKKALLTGAAQGAVVLKAHGREQQYYGEGKAL